MHPTKVCPVVVRRAAPGDEVLVFRHPQAGIQLVKGTIEVGEAPGAAALRELREESGITSAEVSTTLAIWNSGYEEQVWQFVDVRVPGVLPDRWTHHAPDDGGHAFEFFWHPISDPPSAEWHPLFVAALEFIRGRIGEGDETRTPWRPPQRIRPISIALVYRGTDILVMAVRDGSGSIRGWRPLGGAIEFGESAAEAIRREFLEEIGASIRCVRQVCVLENRFQHEAVRGHEIVFVFEAEFLDPTSYTACGSFTDDGITTDVAWRPVREFTEHSQQLFPDELRAHLEKR